MRLNCERVFEEMGNKQNRFLPFLISETTLTFSETFSEIKIFKSHKLIKPTLPFRNISHNFYPIDVFHISIVASNGCSNYLLIQTEKDVTFLLLLTWSLLLLYLSIWHIHLSLHQSSKTGKYYYDFFCKCGSVKRN